MSDKTYSETQGVPAFDWWKALENPGLYANLSIRARSWVTCACGNQCAIIPREQNKDARHHGAPVDGLFAKLGARFYGSICNESWEEAKGVLRSIEDRSTFLVDQELAKRNVRLRTETAAPAGA